MSSGRPGRCGLLEYTIGKLVDLPPYVKGPWLKRQLRYAFGDMSRQIGADVAKAAVRRAIKTWVEAGVGLSFLEVTSLPDFVVEWKPAKDPDCSLVGDYVAHADYPPGFSIIMKNPPLPLHFDDDETKWVDGAVPDGVDIETVALHQLGHILGLRHVSGADAVMNDRMDANTTRRTLTQIDLEGIRNLYPTWRNLSGMWPGNPTVCSSDGDRVDLFLRGLNGNVYHKWRVGGNGTPWVPPQTELENLGGIGYGPVAAVSMFSNHIDLFALGMDNACWHTWWDGNRWGDWETLGGKFTRFTGEFSAVTMNGSRLDVFVRGTDNHVYHKAWIGNDWWPNKVDWEDLGGGLFMGSPKAVSWGQNRIDVFVRGNYNRIYWKTWNGQEWQPSPGWWSLGGTMISDVTPILRGSGLELFAQGADNAVYQKTWNGSAWLPSPDSWTSLNCIAMSKPDAVAWDNDNPLADTVDNGMTVAVRGMDNSVLIRTGNADNWSHAQWERLGGTVTDSPVLDPRGGARGAIYGRWPDAGLAIFD